MKKITLAAQRPIDSLGRVVIPKAYRKHLGINSGDELLVSLENNIITIKPLNFTCAFCESEEDLIEFGGKYICGACKEKLAK